MKTAMVLLTLLLPLSLAQTPVTDDAPLFTYSSSTNRPYCGRAPERTTCSEYDRGIGTISIPTRDDEMQEDADELMEVTAEAWDTIHGSRYGRDFRAAIIDRAHALKRYWKHHRSADLAIITGGFSSSIQSLAATPDAEGNTQEIASRVADAAIQASTPTLAISTDADVILEAASYWWAARALQLLFGCDSVTNAPRHSGDPLILAQFGHQTCRRIYMETAYRQLSGITSLAGDFSLSMPSFVTAYALGSRKERVALFTQALSALLRNDAPLPRAEAGILRSELRQIQLELREGQALTWNGYQPADREDRRMLERLRDQIREALGMAPISESSSRRRAGDSH